MWLRARGWPSRDARLGRRASVCAQMRDAPASDEQRARRLALCAHPLSSRAEASAFAMYTGRRLDVDHRHLDVGRLLMLREREDNATAAARAPLSVQCCTDPPQGSNAPWGFEAPRLVARAVAESGRP